MRSNHYLGFGKTIGERILYVATLNEQWVALMSWASATLHIECRDKWIGWDDLARRKRLNLVVNNTRFLVLRNIPNLASKALALNCRRLSPDWQESYGHPVVLAETFVDPSAFKGTCYKAAGWVDIGFTKGFQRTRNNWYENHGNRKKMFVKPLIRSPQNLLATPFFKENSHSKGVFMIDVKKLPIEGRGGLLDVIKTVSDPRSRRGKRHSQASVLAISACAILSGARSYRAIWQYGKKLSIKQLKRLRCRRDTPPSLSTFERVLQSIDAHEFDLKVNAWLLEVAGGQMKKIAVDGKSLRGSHDGDKKHVHLLSALMHEEKITVAQRDVDGKTNEITQFKPLLKDLPLEGAIVTADPMHCQVDHVKFLVEEKKADFIFTVKGNQKSLLEWVQEITELSKPLETATLSRKGHGRIDCHHLETFVPDQEQMLRQTRFPHIAQVFKITRTSERQTTKKTTSETRYAITSLNTDAANSEDLLMTQVGHWSIEAGHFVRDDTLGEDRSRIRKGSGPQVMATLRNMSIGIIRVSGGKSIAEAIRHFSWERKTQALRAIGCAR